MSQFTDKEAVEIAAERLSSISSHIQNLFDAADNLENNCRQIKAMEKKYDKLLAKFVEAAQEFVEHEARCYQTATNIFGEEKD